MKRLFLVLILLIFGSPANAGEPGSCPCFNDLQVAGICLAADDYYKGKFNISCEKRRGNSFSRWDFFWRTNTDGTQDCETRHLVFTGTGAKPQIIMKEYGNPMDPKEV